MIDKLAIFGVGLIGGSFALALRRAGAVRRVVGVGRSRANLDLAVQLGVVDQATASVSDALSGADFVLVAVPIRQTAAVLGSIAPHLETGGVVTDAGSTKQSVVGDARAALGVRFSSFVPAHPIAGAERSGVGAANADLFKDRLVVLTPLPETAALARKRVEAAWEACGARLVEMDAARHDRVFAAVSHLPHALAFTLVEMIAARPDAAELFSFAGAGFRDFTRIAASSPEMWRDICLANSAALGREIDAFAARLAELAALVRAGDGTRIEQWFETARRARTAWAEKRR